MDKLKNFLKAAETKIVGWITPIAEKCNMEVDKMLHLIVSFVLTFISVNIFGYAVGILCSCLVFVLKEMYDSKKENPTGFSKEDIKYDLYGMCAALLLMIIF